jgi:hypothetical protein
MEHLQYNTIQYSLSQIKNILLYLLYVRLVVLFFIIIYGIRSCVRRRRTVRMPSFDRLHALTTDSVDFWDTHTSQRLFASGLGSCAGSSSSPIKLKNDMFQNQTDCYNDTIDLEGNRIEGISLEVPVPTGRLPTDRTMLSIRLNRTLQPRLCQHSISLFLCMAKKCVSQQSSSSFWR